MWLRLRKSNNLNDQPEIAQESKTAPLAKTVEHSATTTKGETQQIGVDGMRGRCQVFEVAMTIGRESKTDFAPVENDDDSIISG